MALNQGEYSTKTVNHSISNESRPRSQSFSFPASQNRSQTDDEAWHLVQQKKKPPMKAMAPMDRSLKHRTWKRVTKRIQRGREWRGLPDASTQRRSNGTTCQACKCWLNVNPGCVEMSTFFAALHREVVCSAARTETMAGSKICCFPLP